MLHKMLFFAIFVTKYCVFGQNGQKWPKNRAFAQIELAQ